MIAGRFLRRWKRNMLTVAALSLSFLMVLSLSSLSRGMDLAAKGESGDTPREMVIASGGFTPSIERAHTRAMELSSDTRNISAAMPVITTIGRLGFPADGENAGLSGAEPSPSKEYHGEYTTESTGVVGIVPGLARPFVRDGSLIIRSEKLGLDGYFDEEGSPFRDSNYTEGWTGELMIDENLARSYSLGLGDPVLYITTDGRALDAFRVSGFLRTSLLGGGLTSRLLGGVAMGHLGEVQFLEGYGPRNGDGMGREDLCSAIYLDITENASSGQSREDLRASLRELFPAHRIVTSEGRLYRIEEEVLVLTIFSYGVGGTALLIGGLFLSAIMIMDVEDRRKDISIMLAIGISRLRVYLEVLRDSMILALLGTALGVLAGTILMNRLEAYMRVIYGLDIDFFAADGGWVAINAFLMLAFVVVFSLVPGFRAAMMGPGREWEGGKDR